MSNCCGINACCHWFQQHFKTAVESSDDGVQIKIQPTDASKVKALQDLVHSAQKFCQAFCSKP